MCIIIVYLVEICIINENLSAKEEEKEDDGSIYKFCFTRQQRNFYQHVNDNVLHWKATNIADSYISAHECCAEYIGYLKEGVFIDNEQAKGRSIIIHVNGS